MNFVILKLPLLQFYFYHAMIDNFMLIAFTKMTYKKEREMVYFEMFTHIIILMEPQTKTKAISRVCYVKHDNSLL